MKKFLKTAKYGIWEPIRSIIIIPEWDQIRVLGGCQWPIHYESALTIAKTAMI